jgi:branched-chain amino acid transport system substrate-binding protein
MKKFVAIFPLAMLFYLSTAITVWTAKVPGEFLIYLDADFTSARSSSLSIEQGMLTALSEVDNKLAGFTVKLKRKDHRGNTRRSLDNLKDYISDSKALAVFAGLHSPPLLENREFINKNEILVLNPWAAAGPITRYASGINWIFRLSIDDSKAGFALVKHGIVKRNLKRPALLLEKTGWGESNRKTMLRALGEKNLSEAGIYWFNWGLKDLGARMLLREILDSDADSILLVANAPEAKVICRAVIELQGDRTIPIISHWGLTGGNFTKVIQKDLRQNLDLTFLQTSFSFLAENQKPFAKEVAAKASKLFPEDLKNISDIQAPTGFIHGYDLTRLLIAAADQIELTGNAQVDRRKLRDALENINRPVEGLIKTYQRPFKPYSAKNPDAHEALGADELALGRYDNNNHIILEKVDQQ